MNNRNRIEKLLKSYALSASVFLCTKYTAAEIVYVDIDDQVLDAGNTSFDLDIWGKNRFRFNIFLSTSIGSIKTLNAGSIVPLSSNASVAYKGGPTGAQGYIYGLNAVNDINSFYYGFGNSFTRLANMGDYYRYQTGGTKARGNLRGEGYIGFRFDESPNGYYGWIRVTIPHDFSSITILDYAYNNEDWGAIKAGEKPSDSLPVELVSFNAVSQHNIVKLEWSTASEKDNVGFILERRVAGELDWDTIASHVTDESLRGHGTTSEKHSYSLTDSNVNIGDTYEYLLSDVDINGTVEFKKIATVTIEETPINFTLHQNYPNPFNPITTIEFALEETQNVKLSIYKMSGQLVKTLINGELGAGNHSSEWNADIVSAGTYFFQLQAGSQKEIKKAVLVK